MRGVEVLAAITATAALSGATGSIIGLRDETEARETAITAQACLDAYGTGKNDSISQGTLDCLRSGWVPGGHSADPNLKAGEPNGLYVGFIKEERAKGSDLKKWPIIIWVVGGAAVGCLSLMKESETTSETPTQNTKSQPSTAANSGGVKLTK